MLGDNRRVCRLLLIGRIQDVGGLLHVTLVCLRCLWNIRESALVCQCGHLEHSAISQLDLELRFGGIVYGQLDLYILKSGLDRIERITGHRRIRRLEQLVHPEKQPDRDKQRDSDTNRETRQLQPTDDSVLPRPGSGNNRRRVEN